MRIRRGIGNGNVTLNFSFEPNKTFNWHRARLVQRGALEKAEDFHKSEVYGRVIVKINASAAVLRSNEVLHDIIPVEAYLAPWSRLSRPPDKKASLFGLEDERAKP